LVDSNTGDNRSNILAEATALGMSNAPSILHDSSQVVARSYRASGIPEAIVVNMGNFQIAYRGAIDDRLGSTAAASTQHYLSNALTRVLAGSVVSPKETRLDGCGLALQPAYPNLSYSADIAPLLQDKCVRCHSPGNIGAFNMSSHAVIQSLAPTIRHEVLTGHMPPWHADPYYGQFSNDASLTSQQLTKLIQWIDDGAPRGLGSDPLVDNPPPATNYPAAWPSSLGQPSAILRIPAQSVPASGTIAYRYITVVNNAFATDVWLRAAVCRPGDARVVHHCPWAGWPGSMPVMCPVRTRRHSRPAPANCSSAGNNSLSRCTTRRSVRRPQTKPNWVFTCQHLRRLIRCRPRPRTASGLTSRRMLPIISPRHSFLPPAR